jgi:hypothetical protein
VEVDAVNTIILGGCKPGLRDSRKQRESDRFRPVTALLAIALLISPGPFRDEAAGFEARFVGEPVKDEKTQVVRGVTIVTHRYIEEVNGLGLVVSWSDHPESAKTTAEQRLLAVRDTALDGASAQTDVALDSKEFGAPGREFTFEKEGVRVSQRAFVRGNRLFQALAVRSIGAQREIAVRTFLDAFKLLPAKPAAKKAGKTVPR